MNEGLAIQDGDALVIVDVLNNLLAGDGAIPAGEGVIPPLRRIIELFHHRGLPIYATETEGAECASALGLPAFTMMISRPPASADVSGFSGTKLEFQLMMYGVKRLLIGGLGDGVAATAGDAIKRGHQVVVLRDAVRVHPANEQALADLAALGAASVSAAEVA